jgi:hypothetical protein
MKSQNYAVPGYRARWIPVRETTLPGGRELWPPTAADVVTFLAEQSIAEKHPLLAPAQSSV